MTPPHPTDPQWPPKVPHVALSQNLSHSIFSMFKSVRTGMEHSPQWSTQDLPGQVPSACCMKASGRILIFSRPDLQTEVRPCPAASHQAQNLVPASGNSYLPLPLIHGLLGLFPGAFFRAGMRYHRTILPQYTHSQKALERDSGGPCQHW